MKKNFVYSGYLERERDGKHQCSWASEVCLSKKNKVLHALDFVSINLLFSWETQVLRKTTFVTLILGIVYQTLKGIITLTVGALFFLQQEGEEKVERRASQFCSFIMLITFCPVTSF